MSECQDAFSGPGGGNLYKFIDDSAGPLVTAATEVNGLPPRGFGLNHGLHLLLISVGGSVAALADSLLAFDANR